MRVFCGMGILPNDPNLVEMTICGRKKFSRICQFFDSWHFKEIRLTIKLCLTTVRFLNFQKFSSESSVCPFHIILKSHYQKMWLDHENPNTVLNEKHHNSKGWNSNIAGFRVEISKNHFGSFSTHFGLNSRITWSSEVIYCWVNSLILCFYLCVIDVWIRRRNCGFVQTQFKQF